VLVLADNCDDATAARARAAGAEVWERRDETRPGKGHALEAFFAGAAAREGVDAFVLVDADSEVSPDLPAVFNRALAAGASWIQCHYGVRNPDASWRTRLLTYALSLFNGVWLAGQHALGVGAAFRGNGMCLAAPALERHPWRAATLAEDLEFSWHLRLAGEFVAYAGDAWVRATMVARDPRALASQRLRWESGRSGLRPLVRPRIWSTPGVSPRTRILWTLDLESWPLARVGALAGIAALAAALVLRPAPSAAAAWLGWVVALEWCALALYLLSPFLLGTLPLRYLGTLAFAPFYLIWKGALFFARRPASWVRTGREPAAR